MRSSKGTLFNKSKSKETPSEMNSQKWECSGCGALNTPATKYCAACGKSKG